MRNLYYFVGMLALSGSLNAFAAQNNTNHADVVVAKTPLEVKGGQTTVFEGDDTDERLYVDRINIFLRGLPPAQIKEINPLSISKIPPSGIALLSASQTLALTPEQVQNFTGDQISQLSSEQAKILFSILEDQNFDPIFSQLSKKQVQDFVLRLSPRDMKTLSPLQLSKLDLGIFPKLSTQQFEALSAAQISSFTTGQVNVFTVDQLYWSYQKLKDSERLANFIRIINKEQLISMLKYLPRTIYGQVFSSANPQVILGLINSVNAEEQDYIVSRLNAFMISQIYSDLNKGLIEKLKPEQLIFIPKEALN